MLKGKTVVVGVCGGIAAYKSVEIVSRLKKLNADVHVIMTENATKFVQPLTFRSLSHNPVLVDMFEEPKVWDIQHISLAEKADLIVVAPATANIIGKVASGIADDMLSTTIIAADCPVLFVPAMNFRMYENPVVQRNINTLTDLGYIFMEPESGQMACGTSGKGRLPSPEAIVNYINDLLAKSKDYSDMKVLITAGPTREAIDPVRFITNPSSGKMGYAIAAAACERGASVRLISGPVNLEKPCGVETVYVTRAMEMYNEVMKVYKNYDVLIMVAAVADYRCAQIADRKIKKSDDNLTIELVRNPDIAAELGKVKGDRILVGFSAETDNLLKNASGKLISKNMDMIVANDVTMEGAGFGADTNVVKLIKRGGNIVDLPVMSKKDVAHRILDEILNIKNQNEIDRT
ncbi:MAG TPA: bifunctional phosphopantothenoylcysteine decarboxylase/phosphopantothenate--cysteine ligase CoaBC [Acetivibrio sp.]|nr:bifunctional phosphopantothenoylcysteine decarboxylase/phosphopantothenate--cysteine ligase CoaBC [Clostridium sp.]HOQ36181.1 bifunctional phosphopantothenoylcysteine decarboxylase/phosphopantothenate--cysteine ligase CoaBC [Acetivibrio sp.]HPT90076.1 bifunctional phosphopantothenoylcysteine decarboxylase/phosphopantothenate--cysteine ligase CoaBC [Acetivibrio sp.]